MVRVIVVVKGGIVQSIHTDIPDKLSIDVIDYDEVNDPGCSQEYKDGAEALEKLIKDKDMSIVY